MIDDSPLHLYKSLSNSSATVFSNLLTKVFSCSPVCPDAATATLYFCSRSTSLFCNLTYSWRNRLRCRSSLATWPTSIHKLMGNNKKILVLGTATRQLSARYSNSTTNPLPLPLPHTLVRTSCTLRPSFIVDKWANLLVSFVLCWGLTIQELYLFMNVVSGRGMI